MADIDKFFTTLVANGGSDLHLSATKKPMVRVDGEMKNLDAFPENTPEETRRLIEEIMDARARQEFDERNDTDFAYAIEGLARFRCNVFRDRFGMGGVFRVIPSKVLTADQLDLPQAVRDLCYLSKGLVLVTGPTGSGKSTTLAAMIDLINRTRSDHIITIEDPVEFVHEDKKCIINQREVHNHTQSFANALRAALRQDPDIVLVGEMRDLETIEIAIETAETGHLVFGTLHTNTAASTVDRIIDSFPANRQDQIRTMLSTSLKGAISQTLCKKKGGGRIAGIEILLVDTGIAAMIRDRKTFQIPSSMQIGGAKGMRILNDELLRFVKEDLVDIKEAYIKAVDKDGFLEKCRKADIPLPNMSEIALEAGGAVPQKSPAPVEAAPPEPAMKKKKGLFG